MFYRDDDINVYTSVDELKRIHEPFVKHNKIHTVACEMKDLWYNKGLFWFLLTDPHINVELHGWQHEKYATWHDKDQLFLELNQAQLYWEDNAMRMLAIDKLSDLKRITTFFPPWNKVSLNLRTVIDRMRLKLSYEDKDCHWMFHYWSTTPKEVEEQIR